MAVQDAPRRSRSRGGSRATLARAQRQVGVTFDSADLSLLRRAVEDVPWIEVMGPTTGLNTGELTEQPLTIPQADAQTALRGVVRLVADLPRDSNPFVVWQDRGSELWVDTGSTTLACKVGVVTIGVPVRCDQHPTTTRIEVPFGVGTQERPAGLIMSALTHLTGPEVIVARWGEAITAFAWESLVETARRLCELLDTDSRGRRLVPGGIASGSGVLIIQPMSALAGRISR